MRNRGPYHGEHEKRARIENKIKRQILEDEGQDKPNPAKHFDKSNASYDSGIEVGYPKHFAGKSIYGLKQTISPAHRKDQEEQDLKRHF